MVAMSTATAPRMVTGDWSGPLIWSMPPIKMIPLMAFVTLMSGVWSDGVTFQITCQPMITASTNTVR